MAAAANCERHNNSNNIMHPNALHLTVAHQLRVLCTIKIMCVYLMCVRITYYQYSCDYCYYSIAIILRSSHPAYPPIFHQSRTTFVLSLSFSHPLLLTESAISMMPYLRCTFHSFVCLSSLSSKIEMNVRLQRH